MARPVRPEFLSLYNGKIWRRFLSRTSSENGPPNLIHISQSDSCEAQTLGFIQQFDKSGRINGKCP